MKIDYSGELVKIITNKGTFSCNCVIASFPLGVLKSKQVTFMPDLPTPYRVTIDNMGSGVANKIYVSFDKKFWGSRKGWLNFYSKAKVNRYPMALILPENNQNILLFFISGH